MKTTVAMLILLISFISADAGGGEPLLHNGYGVEIESFEKTDPGFRIYIDDQTFIGMRIAKFVFFRAASDGSKIADLHTIERKNRIYVSGHFRNPYDWRFHAINDEKFLLVGFAKGEEELICELFDFSRPEQSEVGMIRMPVDQLRKVGGSIPLLGARLVQGVHIENDEGDLVIKVRVDGDYEGEFKVNFSENKLEFIEGS